MDILAIVKDLFFSVFSIDFSIYIIASWAVLALFCIVLNSCSGRKVVRK